MKDRQGRETPVRASRRARPDAGRAGRSAVPPSPARLERQLGKLLDADVRLEITDNTYTMISFTRRSLVWRVRLHHMFLDASREVLDSLVRYIRGDDRQASATLDAFIHLNRKLIRRIPASVRQRQLPLPTRGRAHDLRTLLDEVLGYYRTHVGDIEDVRDVAISWAPAPRVTIPRRSIKLGSYSADTQVIRIHPALDQAIVPEYFVRWIIFHELLHHRFRADLRARTGRVHTPEFQRLERAFPAFRASMMWERRHLDLLLWWTPAPAVQRLQAG